MRKQLLIFISVIAILGFTNCNKETKYSGNPLFTAPFIADPSVLVHNDTLYLFTGSDEQVKGTDGFLMNKWYVFSTTDMVN